MHRETSTPASEAFFAEEGQHAAAVTEGRGEALRGLLEVIGKGRTPSARLLRMEVLSMMLKTGTGAQTVGEIALRLNCSKRRVEQVFREMRDFATGPRCSIVKFR